MSFFNIRAQVTQWFHWCLYTAVDWWVDRFMEKWCMNIQQVHWENVYYVNNSYVDNSWFPSLWYVVGLQHQRLYSIPYISDYTLSFWHSCYLGHRRWLLFNHDWRRESKAFNGKTKFWLRSREWSEDEILSKLNSLQFGEKTETSGTAKLDEK